MTVAATRIMQRFYEYVDADGNPSAEVEDFNIDATPHWIDVDDLTFDTPAELIAAIRRDGSTFGSTGADWAGDPDGNFIIDYATAEREVVSWHPADTIGDATRIFLVEFVDARTFRDY